MIGLLIHFINFGFGKVEKKSDKQGANLGCGKDVAMAMGYKNPEKALRVHVSFEDKGVNEMVTPVERNKPSS